MNKKTIIIEIVILLAAGGLFLLTRYKTPPSSSTSSNSEDSIPENPTYQHIHSVFKMPDGTILLGAHTGLFKSTDNGKTFERSKNKKYRFDS